MKKCFLLLILITCFSVKSQQSIFYSNSSTKSRAIDKFGLKVYNLNFFKNNEYFNFIADGYTLLGTQLHPEFIYNSTIKTQFKIGVFLLKNFGENKIDTSIPTFSLDYFNGNHQFTIGNLFSKNNHNLIEPIMASEKILTTNVIETGLEYQYKNNYFFADVWLNWENYIRKNDDFREYFTLGISGKGNLVNTNQHILNIPISTVFYHRGGQINKKRIINGSYLSTLDLNTTSIGLNYKTYFTTNSFFNIAYYYIKSKVSKTIEEFPFKNGNAHYIIGTYAVKKFELSLAYFKGNNFISAKGNDMFQSYSTRVNNFLNSDIPDNRFVKHTESNRNLIFFKTHYHKNLSKNILLGIQGEGFYQLNESYLETQKEKIKNHFDFSYGVYVKFDDVFSFSKNKKGNTTI